MKIGQISSEILVLIALILLLMLPLLLYAYGRNATAKEDIAAQKAEFTVQRLASSVDSVGYLGGAAGLVQEIELPQGFRKLKTQGRDIIIEIDSPTGKKEIVKSTGFLIKSIGIENITKEGNYFIEITSLSNFTSGADQVQMRLR